jgi:hypothetical protein
MVSTAVLLVLASRHSPATNHASVGKQRRQVVGPEPAQPRPQAVIGRERRLGLQPDQVLDGPDHGGPPVVRVAGQVGAVEQSLAAKQGPVERPHAQYPR